MHDRGAYLLLPMHLLEALPQACKDAQGRVRPVRAYLPMRRLCIEIVVVFRVNGICPTPDGISRPSESKGSVLGCLGCVAATLASSNLCDKYCIINSDFPQWVRRKKQNSPALARVRRLGMWQEQASHKKVNRKKVRRLAAPLLTWRSETLHLLDFGYPSATLDQSQNPTIS